MTQEYAYRQYAILRPTEEVDALYWEGSLDDLRKLTLRSLGSEKDRAPLDDPRNFAVLSAPTREWKPVLVGECDDLKQASRPRELIISCGFANPDLLRRFRSLVEAGQGISFLSVGADPGGRLADHWCPGGETRSVFGHRADAQRLLEVGVLAANGLNGRDVNVVLLDDGLNEGAIAAANWGGGLAHHRTLPGTAPPTSHGMLIARNILSIAPDAVLYDVPVLPSRIADVPLFTSDAQAVYVWLIFLIGLLRAFPRWSGPWILVNAWAISDRGSEVPLGDYTENTSPGGHPFNTIVRTAVQNRIDVVFAAGNCGLFCPDSRCGKLDRGPGHSIWGANSHPDVITVGAVRADQLWLGYSSQGPGQELLDMRKPDFCAPSQFCETTDAARHNTGTSTACALTAGVVAALRSNPHSDWSASRVSPAALKWRLNATARKTDGAAWNDRHGHGVLNAGAAFERLSIDFP